MDISRLPNPTEKDYVRLERYQKEYEALMEMFREACEIQYPTLVEDAGKLSEWECRCSIELLPLPLEFQNSK